MKKQYLIGPFLLLFLSVNLMADETQSTGEKVVDATAHVLASGAFTFSTCVIITRFSPDMKLFPKYLISASVGMLPGVMKEIYDSNDAHNEFDPIDIGWNALGATGGLLLHYFLFDKTGNKQRATFNYNSKQGVYMSYTFRF